MSNLTSDQLDILLAAARPLPPAVHASFFEEVTAALAVNPELGDGVVYRTARELQRKYWDPPNLIGDRRPRWAR